MAFSTTITAPLHVLPMLMEGCAGSCEPSSTALLTSGLVAGDEEAFRQFHALYFDRLFRYHLVIARGDEEMARDALQETFTRVARKSKRFDNEQAFWSWLALLARCAAIDAGRRRQRYWVVLRDYATAWFRQDQPEEADPNLHDLLELSLASLERGERELIEAKYLYGATVRDLARHSGASEKAIESRLLRLRRKLRGHMLQSLRDDERSR